MVRGDVKVVRGNIEFDRYFATDGRKPFNWVIHPEGFNGAPLLDLAPARLDAEAGTVETVALG